MSTATHTASSAWSFVTARTFGVQPPELVAQWREFLEPSYVGRRPIDWALLRLVVVDVWPGEQADYIYEYDPPGYGPDSDLAPTSPQLSMLISWRSELGGRAHRGRTFWGPSRASAVQNGTEVVNVDNNTAAIREFAFQMLDKFPPGSLAGTPVHAIISRRLNGVPRTPWVFVPVTTYQVDPVLRTIRKRNDSPPDYQQ